MGKLYVVWVVLWTETERGWGQRPDGWSLHRSRELASKQSQAMMSEQRRVFRRRGVRGIPDEYSYPSVNPYPARVGFKRYRRVTAGGGLRVYGAYGDRPKPTRLKGHKEAERRAEARSYGDLD